MRNSESIKMDLLIREIVERGCREQVERLNGHLKPHLISSDYEARRSVIAFNIQEWQLNPYGDAHGGIIASMFDTAMGVTAHWIAGGARTTTVDLMTNYVAPMPCNDEMMIYSKVQKAGRTLIRVTAEAFAKTTDHLVATATANFMVIGQPPKSPEELNV